MDEAACRDNEGGISLFDIALILIKRAKMIVTITFGVALITVVVSLLLPEIYEGKSRIIPAQQGGSGVGMAIMSQLSSAVGLPSGLMGGTASSSDLYVGMLTGRTIIDAIIDRFQLMQVYQLETRVDTRKALLDNLEASTDVKSGIISIQVYDREPTRAAEMANALVEELIKLNRDLVVGDATRRKDLFERQLKQAQEELSNAEEALKGFQETTGAIKIESQAGAVLDGIALLRSQIASKEIELKIMKTYATPANREVKLLEETLAGLKEQLRKLEDGDQGSYGNTNIRTNEVPTLATEYLRKAREFKFRETVYGIIKSQYESARQDEVNNASAIQVIDSAEVPERRAKPRRSLMVIFATMGGGFFAVLIALLAEYRERLVQDPGNSERLAKLQEYLKPFKNSPILTKAYEFFRRW